MRTINPDANYSAHPAETNPQHASD